MRGSKTARVILRVDKKYVWREADQMGEVDDGEELVAYFDDLFLTRVSEPKGPARAPSGTADFWQGFGPRGPPRTARYGHDLVEAPRLQLHAIGDDGHEASAAALLRLRSDKHVSLRVEVTAPRDEEGVSGKYRLQQATVAASNNQFNWGRRPTLELRVYRQDDPDRRALDLDVSDGGTGGGPAGSAVSVSLRISASSRDRVRAIRTLLECIQRAVSASKMKDAAAPPTDEQLLAAPIASMVTANPVGEFAIVARYEALEAGFWHEPVFSEPLRIGIVAAPPPCPAGPPAQ